MSEENTPQDPKAVDHVEETATPQEVEQTIEAPVEEVVAVVEQESVNPVEKGETPEVVVKEDPKVIEKKDYASLSKEELTAELQSLIKNEKITDIKEHAEEISAAINTLFDAEQDVAKEASR